MTFSQPAYVLEALPRHPSERAASVKSRLEDPQGTNENTQVPSDVASVGRTKSQILRERLQLATLFWCMFLAGWNDGTTGPLLPRIQVHYKVSDTIVSLIFVFACVGFVTGACLIVPLFNRFGFGKTIVVGAILHMIASALQSARLPFPVFVMAYVLGGIAISVQDAGASAYVANIKENAETKMGLLHAAYGAGALCAPLVSTQFAQMEQWSYHFLCTLGIGFFASIALSFAFRFKSQEECLADIGQFPDEGSANNRSSFKHILAQRRVHLLAIFILVYVGVEVTIGGWIVTYVIRLRDGGPDSGYISAGFFAGKPTLLFSLSPRYECPAGLTLGRVVLLWLNAKIGERRVMYLYTLLAIGLELVVWLVPSLIGGGVAIALVGVLLGPMYPIALNHAGRILPRWLLTGAIGWICGFGQSGAAVVPFMTGALAGKFGIGSLQPLLVAMMAIMIVLWAIVPGGPRKVD
ncbi:hypothetical protein VNI00_012396 [Paramarasmius palmivorus]|uniref:Major facilitator superfamily (MFS) profile domain-containing protein n=1 Tax=Paramarasmius palmivorus TaxID=297713 RepID=A0AAW0C7U1_9AGAR